jgi:hypothetical protein
MLVGFLENIPETSYQSQLAALVAGNMVEYSDAHG